MVCFLPHSFLPNWQTRVITPKITDINLFPSTELGVHCAVLQVVLRHLLNPPESLLFQWIPGDYLLSGGIYVLIDLEHIGVFVS